MEGDLDSDGGAGRSSLGRGPSDSGAPLGSTVPEPLLGKPSKILEWILDGDPLELEARCREHLERNALLLDPERLFLRSAAVVANSARRYDGRPALQQWLMLQLEIAFQQLRREDLIAALSGEPIEVEQRIDHAYLIGLLGLSPEDARHAALVFNALPERVRHAWWATAIDGLSLLEASRRGMGPPEGLHSSVKRAVAALSQLSDPEVNLELEEWSDG